MLDCANPPKRSPKAFLPASSLDASRERLSSWKDDLIGFAQELVRIASPSGKEGDLARCVADRMRLLGLAEVLVDEAGNVVGAVRGRNPGRTTLLATHLDSPDLGDRDLWPCDPLGGIVSQGFLHGLGASSHKAALAAQVFATAALAADGLEGGNLVVASVVASERSGLGMQVLLDRTLAGLGLSPSFVILGDPTGLSIFLGHRGRVEIEVATLGRTSHASVPWLGLNAVDKMIPVLEGVSELATALPSHPLLDRSTLAVTGLRTLPERPGCIPDRCVASIERRYLPGESLDSVVSQVKTIVARRSAQDPEFKAEVGVRAQDERTYTGLQGSVPKVMAPWLMRDDHPLVGQALEALATVGQEPGVDKWFFATDGSYTAGTLGIPTIGYSPGQERYSHTPFDRVRVDDIPLAAIGTAAIASCLGSTHDA